MKTLKELIKEIEDSDAHSCIEYNAMVKWFKKLEWQLIVYRCRQFGIGI